MSSNFLALISIFPPSPVAPSSTLLKKRELSRTILPPEFREISPDFPSSGALLVISVSVKLIEGASIFILPALPLFVALLLIKALVNSSKPV